MSTITAPPALAPATAPSLTFARRAALISGIAYLVTFASSIPALELENSALKHAGFLVHPGSDAKLMVGGVLDVINAIGAVATAVALYPLLRRRHPGLALGFVTSRALEAATVLTSVVALLGLVTLHQSGAHAVGAERTATLVSGKSLIALHDWAFILGPGLIPAVNALMFATVLYRTGLVPRIIPTIGLIGAPILIGSALAVVFGAYDHTSSATVFLALPIAAWELSVGSYMIVKGFRPEALSRFER